MTLLADVWTANSFEMALLAAAAFGVLGIAMLALGFKVFEWITPRLKVEEELTKGNVAVGIMVGAVLLGISLIVVRAIGGEPVPMKQLTIVVKPFRAEAVLRLIAELGVTACAVREAKGYGRQKGYLDRYRGSEFSTAYLPKVEITVWVTDEQATELADKLPRVARTGRIGDGKVFVVPLAWPEPLEF